MEKIKDEKLTDLLNIIISRKCKPQRMTNVRIFVRPPLGFRSILGLASYGAKSNTIWLSHLLLPQYNNSKGDMTMLVSVSLHEVAHIICDVSGCGEKHDAGWWKVMASFGLYPESPDGRLDGSKANLKLKRFPKYIVNLFMGYGCPYESLCPKGFDDRQIQFFRDNGQLVKDFLD